MSAVLDLPRHRFSRAQYEQMVDAGVFGPDERLELLDGEVIDMAPQKSRHATAVTLLADTFNSLFSSGYTVRVQLPLRLSDLSMPEPDIAVVPGNPRDYRDAHPACAVLIVEVADTTLAYDRSRKLAAYALAGIQEYWVLDVAGETLEVCRQPQDAGYAERRVLKQGETVRPLAGSGDVAVADILP